MNKRRDNVIRFLLVAAVSLLAIAANGRWIRTECRQADSAKRKQCQVEEVERTLAKLDFTTSWKLLEQFSNEDPSFAETCHALSHSIGKTAYRFFASGRKVPVTKETSYCSYGFYHEFMNVLLKDGQPVARAREFCEYVGKEMRNTSPDAYYACFHGMGHGWTNVHEKAYWGNPLTMVTPGLALCDEIAQNTQELLRCTTGVFDSISLGYYNRQGGLVMRADDPLWLCREVPEKFLEACYRDLMPAILWLGEYNLEKSAPYIEKHVPRAFGNPAISTLSSDSVRYSIGKKEDWQSESLAVCRRLRQDLRIPCVAGLATGMMEFGAGEAAHTLALSFCRRSELSDKERETCFEGVTRFIATRYQRNRAFAVCRTIEPTYARACAL